MELICYARFQFPPTVIQHAIWLYLRFNLGLRDVEELLAEHGHDISYETIRLWIARFGTAYAKSLRVRRPRSDAHWHLDQMFVSIGGRQIYLWRTVDGEGEVLDMLVPPKRHKKAAIKLLHRLLKKQGIDPTSITTDKLGSYSGALHDLGLRDRHAPGH